MSASLVGRFEHLPKRPRSDEARPLLEKIASQVKPIMSKRGWKVGTLAEFLPSNPALLGNNMNAGERINLRLRPPGDTSTFYEYDQLVLVMLHELTHNEHGPHNASFYKLLAELEEEYYDLKRKGYSGEGFHGSGNHLAGMRVPEYVGKAKGLAAAEQRAAVQRKIGRGGVLGGRAVAGRTVREVVAEAAERRLRDDKACATGAEGEQAKREADDEARKAMEESVGIDVGEVVEIPGPSKPKSSSPRPSPPTSLQPRPSSARPPPPPPSASSAPPPSRPASLPSGEWACPTCTLLNSPSSLTCDACTTPRPRNNDSQARGGWWCEFCGAGPREMTFWSCAECGWVRKSG